MIKKHGGIFGRNPTFNDVTVEGTLSIEGPIVINGNTFSGLDYEGAWNASTNTPTLTSSVGTLGQFYIVSVAGNTNLDGETNWQVGDWAVFNGSVWQKVDGGSTGLLTTLTVTGNTYLATTSGSVGVGTTSILAGMSLDVDGLAAVGTQTPASGIGGNIRYRDDTGTQRYAVGILGAPAETGFSFYDVVASTERIRITSAGDVGIGTSSPTVKLEVGGNTANAIQAAFTSGADSNFKLYAVNGSATSASGEEVARFGVGYGGNTTTNFSAGFSFIRGGGAADGALAILTNATERMRINSSGNLLVGTTTALLPAAGRGNITLNGSSDAVLAFGIGGVSSGYVYSSSTNLEIDAAGSRYLQFNTNGVERMRLDSSGNLGLGVTPSAWASGYKAFQVGATGAVWQSTSGFTFLSDNTYVDSGATTRYITSNFATIYRQQAGQHNWFTAPSGTAGNAISFTQAMTLDANGLAIGTSSPVGRLTLRGAAGTSGKNQGILIEYSNGTEYGAFGLNDSSGWPQLMARAGAGLTFHVNSDLVTTGEAMRLDSSGNLGIGTSSPGAKLDVAGKINASSAISGDVIANFVNTDAAGYGLRTVGGASGGGYALSVNNYASGELMRVDGNGNVGIGTSSPGVKLDVQGGSINTSSWVTIAPTTATNNALYRSTNTGGTLFSGLDNSAGGVTGTGYAGVLWHTGNYPMVFATNNTERMRLDSAGNLGLGVTPNANWNANHRVFELAGASTAHVLAYVNGISVGANYYVNSGDNYIYTFTGQNATRYAQTTGGQHQWFTAPSGTAGNTISFTQAMTLDASGNLGLGGTPAAWGSTSRALGIAASTAAFVSGRTDAFRLHVGLNAYESASDVWNYTASLAASRYTQIDGQHQWFNAASGTAGNAITFTQAMTLDASGNLLVGATSNPGVLNTTVVIDSGANSLGGVVIQNNTTGRTFNDGGHLYMSGAEMRLYNAENNVLMFGTNNTERMRITAAGDIGIGGTSFGSGALVMFIANATTAPTTNPTGGGILYVEGGALKYRGSSGTVTTIANA
jgi:hypothetical protein